jgi:hypothetical protein
MWKIKRHDGKTNTDMMACKDLFREQGRKCKYCDQSIVLTTLRFDQINSMVTCETCFILSVDYTVSEFSSQYGHEHGDVIKKKKLSVIEKIVGYI